jgi:hypothetical protein
MTRTHCHSERRAVDRHDTDQDVQVPLAHDLSKESPAWPCPACAHPLARPHSTAAANALKTARYRWRVSRAACTACSEGAVGRHRGALRGRGCCCELARCMCCALPVLAACYESYFVRCSSGVALRGERAP